MKILAVDDEEGALKILVRAITSAAPDGEIMQFTDPREALAASEATPPDIAFLDIRMSGVSGVELARQLKQFNPMLNIIFTTAYSDYTMDALQLRSSGYLIKPITAGDVRTELENLRNPIPDFSRSRFIYAKTFGRFDLFVGGEPVKFRRERSKELLAYLIDQGGSSVTRKDIAAAVFEDREYTRATQAYLSQIIKNMVISLRDVGAEQLLISDYNSYAVDPTQFSCDAYEYFKGSPDAMNAFSGEYMVQYSWAEESIGRFYD